MRWVLDEVVDPFACEYHELVAGGIYLPEAGGPAVPHLIADPETDDSPSWFASAVVSENWFDAFHRESDWRRIEAPP